MGGTDKVKENFNYNNKQMAEFWNEMAEGFYNYGRLSPQTDISNMKNLVTANYNMVDYIIKKCDITKDSHILDLGCGPGMYTVDIAVKTGCSFLGTDINARYMEEGETLAKNRGVAERGSFLVSSWEDVNPEIKSGKFTHILALGSLLYGHHILEKIFKDIAEWSNPETKIFIWDLTRKLPWEECGLAQAHLKMKQPIASVAEVLGEVNKSEMELYDFEDVTQYIIPGYKIMTRVCKERDPDMKIFTYPLLGKAFMTDIMAYVIFYLRLRPKSDK